MRGQSRDDVIDKELCAGEAPGKDQAFVMSKLSLSLAGISPSLLLLATCQAGDVSAAAAICWSTEALQPAGGLH